MEFYEIIRELREQKEPKVTQNDLAKIMKTNQRKISRLETGEAEPSLDDIRALSKYYNVSSDYLLGLPNNLPYPKKQL